MKKTMGRGASPKRGTRGETTKNKPPLLTAGQQLGRVRWKGKTMTEKRAHAMMMVRARRKKLRERARMVTSDGDVLAAQAGDLEFNDHIGSRPDLWRDWQVLLDAAELTDDERAEAEKIFRQAVNSREREEGE